MLCTLQVPQILHKGPYAVPEMTDWVNINLRLKKKQAAALQKMSEDTGFDRSSLIRLAVARFLDSENRMHDPLPRVKEAESS